jgi:hypothetical protein
MSPIAVRRPGGVVPSFLLSIAPVKVTDKVDTFAREVFGDGM